MNQKKAETEDMAQGKEEMLSEYDFSGEKGILGNYYPAYREGHTARAREEDATESIWYFTLEVSS